MDHQSFHQCYKLLISTNEKKQCYLSTYMGWIMTGVGFFLKI